LQRLKNAFNIARSSRKYNIFCAGAFTTFPPRTAAPAGEVSCVQPCHRRGDRRGGREYSTAQSPGNRPPARGVSRVHRPLICARRSTAIGMGHETAELKLHRESINPEIEKTCTDPEPQYPASERLVTEVLQEKFRSTDWGRRPNWNGGCSICGRWSKA